MELTQLTNIFESFNQMNVLIIGDVMIDGYVWGKVDRISPEAPVPVLSVAKKEDRLGGAANVALNIQSMGAKPILCSVIGDDENGKKFIALLNDLNISAEGILKSKDRITTLKTRVIKDQQHLLRIDEEIDQPLNLQEENNFIENVKNIIASHKIDVIIFQDYDKGVLTNHNIEKLISIAQNAGIKTVVDPKKRNFLTYKNVGLFKPNLKELKDGLKIEFNHLSDDQLVAASKELKNKINANAVLITLSEHGVFLMDSENNYKIPAHIRNISDVSGAGDTVISVAALCYAGEMPNEKIAAIANLAGGLVCEKVGVVPINKLALLSEAAALKN
jgi:rfaE bifunctional protein kinase chain/domain